MDVSKQQEEGLREACCYNDVDTVLSLISRGVNVNSQHDINKWTGLHWACKRGHTEVVRLLLKNGADTDIENNQAQKPADLTTNAQILKLIGSDRKACKEAGRETSNYLSNHTKNSFGQPLSNGIEGSSSGGGGGGSGMGSGGGGISAVVGGGTATVTAATTAAATTAAATTAAATTASTQTSACQQQQQDQMNKELVLKVRIANSEDQDFIEVEFSKTHPMTYSSLLTTCCRELAVNPQTVERIRKLPNTRMRSDRDAQRLTDYTELELVLKGYHHHQHHSTTTTATQQQQNSSTTSKNNYSSIQGFKNQTILY